MTQPQVEQPKALSDLAYWLAVQHQGEQQQIGNKAAAGLALLWGLLRYDRLDETTPAWLHAVTLQVQQSFRESEEAAFQFVQGSKWAVEPFSDPLEKVTTQFPVRDFQLAMRATGPATVKRATARAFAGPVGDSGGVLGQVAPEVPAADIAAVESDVLALGKLTSTGAGVKHALNGGRGEVEQLVVIDAAERFRNREAIGWARFTEDSDTGPCYFCAILASQGAIYYGSDSFDRSNSKIRDFTTWKPIGEDQQYLAGLLAKLDARAEAKGLTKQTVRRAFVGDGPAKVHDHCKCTLRPVYRKQDSMDARAKYFLRQWTSMTKRLEAGGDYREKIKEFRRVYKRPPAYSDRPELNLAAIRRNRELVAQALGASSPHAKWWDRQIRALEAA